MVRSVSPICKVSSLSGCPHFRMAFHTHHTTNHLYCDVSSFRGCRDPPHDIFDKEPLAMLTHIRERDRVLLCQCSNSCDQPGCRTLRLVPRAQGRRCARGPCLQTNYNKQTLWMPSIVWLSTRSTPPATHVVCLVLLTHHKK